VIGLRAVLAGLAVAACLTAGPATAAAQGIPGTAANATGAAAWDALDAGRDAEAADLFDDAIALEPRDPSLYLGAGAAAFLLGRPADARARLEQALMLSPGYSAASLLLGNVLDRGGDTAGALAVYDAALAHAPDH
jgi:tetratricopeptide (TPR) repeat protein